MFKKKKENTLKVTVVGDSGTGKTSLTFCVAGYEYQENRETTIGANFITDNPNQDSHDQKRKLQFWDTAGQERYASLAPMYYRNADAIVAVYDVTDKGSYFKALSWLKETSGMTSFSPTENAMLVLVGNKIDYPVEDHEVSTELGRKGTKSELGLADIFMETSAKTGDNVHVLFSEIAKKLAEKVESESVEDRDLFRIEPPPKLMSSCC